MSTVAMRWAGSKRESPIRPKREGSTIDLSPSPDRHPWAGCDRCGAMWDIYPTVGTTCWDLFVEGIA